jgi:hypothetical protein
MLWLPLSPLVVFQYLNQKSSGTPLLVFPRRLQRLSSNIQSSVCRSYYFEVQNMIPPAECFKMKFCRCRLIPPRPRSARTELPSCHKIAPWAQSNSDGSSVAVWITNHGSRSQPLFLKPLDLLPLVISSTSQLNSSTVVRKMF